MTGGGVEDKCTTFLTRTAPEKDVEGLFVVVVFFRENGRKRLTGGRKKGSCLFCKIFYRNFVFF